MACAFRLVPITGFESIREDLDNAIRNNVVADPLCYIRLEGGRVNLISTNLPCGVAYASLLGCSLDEEFVVLRSIVGVASKEHAKYSVVTKYVCVIIDLLTAVLSA